MKIEVQISNWKRISNTSVLEEVARWLMELAHKDDFEKESQSVQNPTWNIDDSAESGLELEIRLRK